MKLWRTKGKHHVVTSEAKMEVQSSREFTMHWIARKIALEGENGSWVIGLLIHITKASFSFPAKVWWVVVYAQLRPTGNDNTLSPSLASLVACLMAGYPVKGNCVGKQAPSPNRLVDRWSEAFRLTQASNIKDVSNHLFGAKARGAGSLAVVSHVPIDISHADRGPEHGESSHPSTEAPPPPALASQALGTFVTIPTLFLEKLVADQRQTRTLVDQIVCWMPQLIELDVLAMEKKIKDEMQKELAILKYRMDGLDVLVQDRLQGAG
uniref:Integrase core domain containing protein n=1 Tax=Solanum tuberosum TaxID=4113 RepID=M1DFB9_SOLTU